MFCSDPISSVAYATEQIVLVRGAGGLAALTLTPWVGLAGAVCRKPRPRGCPSGRPPPWALFYLFQAATAGILILAANTAFNGFPVLASILGQHRYLPRQLHNRGDRLVFSNGILLLAAFAVALIIGFDANIDKLIQLYIRRSRVIARSWRRG